MEKKEIIEGIKNFKDNGERNLMGCSENWYDFYYAMKETFSTEEINELTKRECTLLYRLASSIQEGLY